MFVIFIGSCPISWSMCSTSKQISLYFINSISFSGLPISTSVLLSMSPEHIELYVCVSLLQQTCLKWMDHHRLVVKVHTSMLMTCVFKFLPVCPVFVKRASSTMCVIFLKCQFKQKGWCVPMQEPLSWPTSTQGHINMKKKRWQHKLYSWAVLWLASASFDVAPHCIRSWKHFSCQWTSCIGFACPCVLLRGRMAFAP